MDGDVVRRHLSAGLGFSAIDRDINVRRIGWVAAEVARHGGMAVCCPIAPYEAARQAARDFARAAGAGFILVWVNTPLAECERRDRKGLYAKARAGQITGMTGIDDPYEIPGERRPDDRHHRPAQRRRDRHGAPVPRRQRLDRAAPGHREAGPGHGEAGPGQLKPRMTAAGSATPAAGRT